MTKFTLLAIAAFATSIATTATELAGQASTEGGAETPAAEPTPAKRRGRPANTGISTEGGTATLEPVKEKSVAGGRTIEELKELIKIPVEGSKGDKVKAFLTEHGATKVSDLAAEHHAAFAAAMKKLSLEVEAEQM